MQIKDIIDRVVLTPEQIKELVNDKSRELTPDAAADLMTEIIEQAGETTTASPINKMLYITAQAYLKGFLMALYCTNEAVKAALENMGEGDTV